MAILLNICPFEVDVCISRGDTTAFQFTIRSGTPPVADDITGFSYLLTVDLDQDPTDATNNLFQLTGTITDALNGVVEFSMSTSQADQLPNIYFFDVQQTDGTGAIRTVVIGQYEFRQDISK